ncbi:MAG TPA: hypothetical protein VNL16_07945 [Chloroflexota bacterium]|nr:hypothetical protein [Chloroflexota bacterium]
MSESAVASPAQLPFCSCGKCRQRVKSPENRYVHGHNAKTAEFQLAMARKRGGVLGTAQACARDGCSNPVWVFPNERARTGRRYCSRMCYWLDQRSGLTAYWPLQQRILDRLDGKTGDEPMTFADFCRAVSVTPSDICEWYKADSRTLSESNLGRIGKYFGLTLAEAKEAAGGRSAEDVRAAVGRATYPERFLRRGDPGFEAMQKKAGEARRGLRQSEHQVAQRMERLRSNDRWIGALKSLEARARSSLIRRLEGNSKPSKEQARAWAEDAAARLTDRGVQVTVAIVWVIWRPYLLARGLVHAGGRNPDEARFVLIERVAAKPRWRTASGRKRRGFWDHWARLRTRLDHAEQSPYDPASERSWYVQYRARLPR